MIRSSLKRGLKKILGRENPDARPYAYTPPAPPADEAPVEAFAEAFADAEPSQPVAAPAPEPAPEPAVEAAPAPSVTLDDTAGPPLTPEAVQELLDDMVRPALQADGGDITLIKVEGNDIYVKLVGSCSTCPSSIMTMKMGVEALFKEEFPSMGELIQVD